MVIIIIYIKFTTVGTFYTRIPREMAGTKGGGPRRIWGLGSSKGNMEA